jgi:hypothetical protein
VSPDLWEEHIRPPYEQLPDNHNFGIITWSGSVYEVSSVAFR